MPRSAVDIWLAEVKVFGIRSIICLLGPDQLQLYDQLPTDLVSYYRQAGFEVEHIPIRDHQHPAMSQEDLAKDMGCLREVGQTGSRALQCRYRQDGHGR